MYNRHNCNNMYNTWSSSYIATIRIPPNDPLVSDTFHVSTSSSDFYPLTYFSHCLYLKVSSRKVLIARCKTAMTHARLPCVFIALLLISQDATNEQTSPASFPVGPRDENRVLCALSPLIKKFDPAGVVQPIFSSRCGIETCTRPLVPAFIVNRNPAHWHPVSGFQTLVFMQIQQTHCQNRYK